MSDSRRSLTRSPIQSIPSSHATTPKFTPTYFTTLALMNKHQTRVVSASGPERFRLIPEDSYSYYNKAAHAFLSQDEMSEALKFFQLALEEASKKEDYEKIASTNTEMAQINIEFDDPIEAGNCYRASAIARMKLLDNAKASGDALATIAAAPSSLIPSATATVSAEEDEELEISFDDLSMREEKATPPQNKRTLQKLAIADLKMAIALYDRAQLHDAKNATSALLLELEKALENNTEKEEKEIEEILSDSESGSPSKSPDEEFDEFRRNHLTPSPASMTQLSTILRRKPTTAPIPIPTSNTKMQRSQSDVSSSNGGMRPQGRRF